MIYITCVVAVSFNQPKICSHATWDPNAITFADQSSTGNHPRGIFVDYRNRVFVAPANEWHVVVWSKDGLSSQKKLDYKLREYPGIFISHNADLYLETHQKGGGEIYKSTENPSKSMIVKDFNKLCYSLFIDVNNTLYCSAHNDHQVLSSTLDNKNDNLITAAGTSSGGSSLNQLKNPRGIFVNTNFDLYVADSGNDRIQLFRLGENNGTTVAGKGFPKNLILTKPSDVILDEDGYLYIADTGKNRIMRVGQDDYQCIVACVDQSGSSSSYKLNRPESIRFDSHGNLYIADTDNHRIQKFILQTNSCGRYEKIKERPLSFESPSINDHGSKSMPNLLVECYRNR